MRRDPVGVAGFLLHQLAAFLHQELQSPRFGCVGVQPPELVTVERQDIQEESSITRIVLGAGGANAFSIIRQRRRVNRENDQLVIFRQRKNQRPPTLFQRYSDGLSPETQPELGRPDLHGFGGVIEGSGFPL